MSLGSILLTWLAASVVLAPAVGTVFGRCNPEVTPVRIDIDRSAAPAGSS
jgi:hypothetical protein